MSRTIKNKNAIAIYSEAYRTILQDHNVDLIDMSYFTLPDNIRGAVLTYKANLPYRTTIHSFIRNIRSLAIQYEWRSDVEKLYSTTFDFSENNWPIYAASSVQVYLGMTRDFQIGKAYLTVKGRTVHINAKINAEQRAEHRDLLDSSEIGLGYYDAPGRVD